jgi:hypothetical protein
MVVKAQADLNAHCKSDHGERTVEEYINILFGEAAKVLCLPKERKKRDEMFSRDEFVNVRELLAKDYWYSFGATALKEEGKKGV